MSLQEYQIDRYRSHQGATHRKVILAIGVGGRPDAPDNFYLIPVDSVRNCQLSKAYLDRFATTRSQVKDYIHSYFRDHVFRKPYAKRQQTR